MPGSVFQTFPMLAEMALPRHQVAEITEYQWHRDADVDPFARFLNAAMAGVPAAAYQP